MNQKHIVNNLNKNEGTAYKIAITALLFAVTIVLAVVENSIPTIPNMVPGIKLGLSNIIVMYSLFFVGKGQAMTIAILKGFFVFVTRGMIAGVLSLTGGISSLLIMILLLFWWKNKASYFLLSVMGAVFHNMGQYIAFYLLYPNVSIVAFIPFLLIAGIVAGAVTAKLLSVILPALERLRLNKKQVKTASFKQKKADDK